MLVDKDQFVHSKVCISEALDAICVCICLHYTLGALFYVYCLLSSLYIIACNNNLY